MRDEEPKDLWTDRTRPENIEWIHRNYRGLVVSFVRKFFLSNDELFDDCLQAGFCGLFEAYRRFDASLEYSFCSLAFSLVRWNVIDFIHENNAFGSKNLGMLRRSIYRAKKSIPPDKIGDFDYLVSKINENRSKKISADTVNVVENLVGYDYQKEIELKDSVKSRAVGIELRSSNSCLINKECFIDSMIKSERNELAIQIVKSVWAKGVTARQRIHFLMNYFIDMSQSDIARALHTSPQNVSESIANARKNIWSAFVERKKKVQPRKWAVFPKKNDEKGVCGLKIFFIHGESRCLLCESAYSVCQSLAVENGYDFVDVVDRELWDYRDVAEFVKFNSFDELPIVVVDDGERLTFIPNKGGGGLNVDLLEALLKSSGGKEIGN